MDIENIDELELELEDESQDIDLNIIPTGIEGLSAYEVAVKNGYEGTEEEWLESLKGADGIDGADGSDGITPTIGNNGNWYLGETDTGKPSRGEKGETGATGQDGSDGISPTVTTSKSGKVTTIEIVDVNGTHTATINDGNDGLNGTNGSDGADGFSPIASVSKSGSTATISITDKNGTTTATVNDGINGQDGADGVGVPSGGTTGQVLSKASGTDYDTQWINAPSSGSQTIYDFNLPSYTYWSSSGTTTIQRANFTTQQTEQLDAIVTKGVTDIAIRLIFEPNYPYSFITTLSQKYGTSTKTYRFFGMFTDISNNKNYGAIFEIYIDNGATYANGFSITFSENNGYIRTYDKASFLTKTNTSSYTVTNDYNPAHKKYVDDSISTALGTIETTLGGI